MVKFSRLLDTLNIFLHLKLCVVIHDNVLHILKISMSVLRAPTSVARTVTTPSAPIPAAAMLDTD